MTTKYEATGFERFWNSTFGIPQQVLFRILRSIQDDEVDLLSEEGILDKSLIPFIGMYDKSRNDVSATEMYHRMGGKDKDPHWSKQIASSFVDPLMLLTGGATTVARSAQVTTKALRTKTLARTLQKAGIQPADLMSGVGTRVKNKEFLGHIDDALANIQGAKKGSQRRLLNKAKRSIEALDEGGPKAIQTLLKRGRDTELRFGVPILHNYGLLAKKVTDKNKYWLGFMSSSIGQSAGGRAISTFLGNNVAGLPFIEGATKRLSNLAGGFRHGREATEQVATSSLGTKGMELVQSRLTNEGGDIFQTLGKREGKKLAQEFDKLTTGKNALDPRRAFLRVFGGKKNIPRKEDALQGMFERYSNSFFNVSEGGTIPTLNVTNLTKAGNDFRSKYKVARNWFQNSFTRISDTPAGKAQQLAQEKGKDAFAWWTKGKQVKQLFGRIFSQGGKVAELDEANALLTRLEAQTTSQLRTIGDDLAELLRADAKGMGTDAEALDNLFLKLEQGIPLESEIAQFVTALNTKGTDYSNASEAITNFLSRVLTTVDHAGIHARGGKANPLFRDVIDHVKRRISDEGFHRKVDFDAEFATPGWIPAISDVASILGIKANRAIIREGALTGKIAGTLSNEQLVEAQQAIFKANKVEPVANWRGSKKVWGEQRVLDSSVRLRAGVKEVSVRDAIDHISVNSGKPVREGQKKAAMTDDGVRRALRKMERDGLPANSPEVLRELGFRFNLVKESVGRGKTPLYSIEQRAGKSSLDISWQNKVTANAKSADNFIRSREEAVALLEHLSTTENLVAPFAPSHLGAGARTRYYKLQGILDARAAGDEHQWIARPKARKDLPPRSPAKVGARQEGEALPLNDMGLAMGRLQAVGEELKRAGDKGLAPSLVKEVEDSLTMIRTAFDDGIREVMGENTLFLDATRDLRKRSFLAAAEQGIWHAGAPLGYVGRIFSRESRELLDKTLADRGVMDAISSALPNLGASMARRADNMTIEEVNELAYALKTGPAKERVAAKPFLDAVDAIATSEGIKLGETFTESLFLATVARSQQAVHAQANINYVTSALEAATKSKSGVSGTIVGFNTYGAKEVAGLSLRARTKTQQLNTTTARHEHAVKMQPTAIIVEAADGSRMPVPLSFLTNDSMTGILLGSADTSMETALGIRATRGALKTEEMIASRLTPETLDGLVGQKILFGDKGVVNGIFDSMQSIWKSSSKEMVYVDTAQYLVKRFQTVYRPAFTVTNMASMFSQMSTIGLGVRHQLQGLGDAIRWLDSSSDVSRAYSKWNVHDAAQHREKIGGFIPRPKKNYSLSFVDDIRKAGIDKILKLSPEEVAEQFPHLMDEDLIFRIGGMETAPAELLDVWRETNMFGTFTVEGLRGGGGVTRSNMQIRARALQEDTMLGKAWKVTKSPFKASEKLAEGGEITVRLASFFGGVRAGKTLRQAAEDTLLATVDYAALTRPERFHIKRWITYYTFPRHFLPVAGKAFAADPAKMARAAHTINEGPWREERGRLRYDMPGGEEGLSVDATRMLPHLEALKVMETVGETFLGTGALFSDSAARILAKERLKQDTPLPLTLGSLQQAAFAAGDGREETSALKTVIDAFWISKFAFDKDDPLKEETTLTKFRKVLMPMSDRHLDAEDAMIRRRFNLAKVRLEQALRSTDDLDEQRAIREEINELAGVARKQLKESKE